jgi:ATP-binding cassette subfamily B protein
MEREIITRYIGQPARLPSELRGLVERAWGGQPVQLYALADLDDTLTLAVSWLLLGAEHVAVARASVSGDWDIDVAERSRIRAVLESPGLSANALVLVGAPDDPPIAVVRYTQRQRGAFENIRFVLDEALAGRPVAGIAAADPDRVYADAVARPVRDAQALVAGKESAVMFRLLRYLLPYRKQLTLGLTAAAIVTLASLVPPYIAGYLLDRVVRPAHDGVLDRDTASAMAWLAVATMAGLYVVRQAAAHVRLRLMSVLGEWVARDLRAELYGHIQRLSLAFFSRKKTGSLITRVTADTDRLWEFIAFGVVDVSLSIVMLVGLGAVLLTLDWRLGLVMTVPVPIFCWLIYRHGESLNARFIRAWRKWSRVTDILSDTIPGIRVVKAFNQEEREIKRFDSRNDDVTGEFNEIH